MQLKITAYLRIYKIEFDTKWKTNKAVPISDTVINTYNCPYIAYVKTKKYIKTDWTNKIIQDVWFSSSKI